jgi:F1F0 ATPase subunit 2
MPIDEVLYLIFAMTAGIFLGTIFFGGLWWTIQKAISSPYAAVWFMGSMFLRTIIALTGFYFVGRTHWDRFLVCLLGFIVARVGVTLLTKKSRRLRAS